MKRMVTITAAVVGLSIGCGAGPDDADRSTQTTVPGAAVANHGTTDVDWALA